jgi:CRP-like cAMP-binding protein
LAEDELQSQTFSSGDVIFEGGDAAHCTYLIQEGGVDVFIEKDGVIEVIDTLGPGEIFGEMALVDDLPRSASAMAKLSTTCITVSKPVLEHEINQASPLMRAMVKLFVHRLRRSNKERAANIQ